MEEDRKRTIGFICPSCRQAVLIERTAFELAAAPSRLECPCGKSAVELTPFENDMQITVPCAFCGTEHTATCSNRAFFREKALAFSCAGSGLNCCFVGEEGPVTAALQRLEESLDSLGQDENGARGSFLNEIAMQEVLAELKEIAKRGGISCTCGSREWKLKINYSSVDVVCARCGAELRLPAATADDIDDICCKPYLLIRGRKE